MFEQITGRPFEIKTYLDNYVFYYAMILANNPDEVLEWDEFIDALDNDPKLIGTLTQFMLSQENRNNILNPDEDLKTNKKGSKKNSPSRK